MKWTPRRFEAAIVAIGAMLAGPEGEGDGAGIRFADLEAARDLLVDERDRAARERAARIDAKLRAALARSAP